MLDRIKKEQFRRIMKQQSINAAMMREKSAKYQKALASGEMDASIGMPKFNLNPVNQIATTDDGIQIEVTIWEAKFGGEVVRKIKKEDAQSWLKSKHILWKNGERHMRDRAVAREKLTRINNRIRETLEEVSESIPDETVRLISMATDSILMAIDTLTEGK